MTVVSSIARNDYTGSGITGPYAYTFRIFVATDLAVIQADTGGVETVLSYPADYSVSGVGNRSGGNVTLTSALPSGYALTLQRAVALTQPISLRNQGDYFPENVEDGLDRLTMIAQRQQTDLDQSFKAPSTIPVGGSTIQNFVSRAYIRVNTDGDGLEGVTANVSTVQPLTPGTYLTGSAFDGSQAKTFAVDATSANTPSKVVARDASGNFSAGTITAALSGNATSATTATTATSATSATTATSSTTATKLATARAINGVNFDGSAAITVPAAAGTLTGATLASGVTASSLTSVGVLAALHTTGPVVDSGVLDLSASGAGQVKFPATQNPSANANTLDDYEEGTWTVGITIGGGATGLTYGVQDATYTKIGNRVIARGYVTLSAKGTSTGTVLVTGLPFTTNVTANRLTSVTITTSVLTGVSGHIQGFLLNNSTVINVQYVGTGTESNVTDANLTNNSAFFVMVVYGI